MPQMAPLNWLSLMIYFFFILMLFNVSIYSLFNYKKSEFNIKQFNKINWKW